MSQFQSDLHFIHLEIHLLDAPGSAQAQQLFIKFFVSHDRRISWIPHFFTLTHTKVRSPRKITHNLHQQEKTLKRGIKTKRLKAGWDEEYLVKILFIPMVPEFIMRLPWHIPDEIPVDLDQLTTTTPG